MARSRSTRIQGRSAGPGEWLGDALASRLPALRAALEEQRRFRREQLAALETDAADCAGQDSADLPGPGDRQAMPALREVDALVAAGARQSLADIELALVRMRTGRYGRCRACGDRIPLAVLEAIPRTTLCLGCQREDEDADGAPVHAAAARNRAPRRPEGARRRRRSRRPRSRAAGPVVPDR
jgi:DnaK suppressor protein